jgi:hypothetical protein
VEAFRTWVGWHGLFTISILTSVTLGSYLSKRRFLVWLLRALLVVKTFLLLDKIKEELQDLQEAAFISHLKFCVSDEWVASQAICTSVFGFPKGPWLPAKDTAIQDRQNTPMALLEQCLAERLLPESLVDIYPSPSSWLISQGWWATFGWLDGWHAYGFPADQLRRALHWWSQDVGSGPSVAMDDEYLFNGVGTQPQPYNCWDIIPIYCFILAVTLSSRTMHIKTVFWFSFFMTICFILLPQWRLATLLRSTNFCFEYALRKVGTVSGPWNWRLHVSPRQKLWDQRLVVAKSFLSSVITSDKYPKQQWSWDNFLNNVLGYLKGMYMMPRVQPVLGRNLWWDVVDFLLFLTGIYRLYLYWIRYE